LSPSQISLLADLAFARAATRGAAVEVSASMSKGWRKVATTSPSSQVQFDSTKFSRRVALALNGVAGAMIIDVALLLDLPDHGAAAGMASDQAREGKVMLAAGLTDLARSMTGSGRSWSCAAHSSHGRSSSWRGRSDGRHCDLEHRSDESRQKNFSYGVRPACPIQKRTSGREVSTNWTSWRGAAGTIDLRLCAGPVAFRLACFRARRRNPRGARCFRESIGTELTPRRNTWCRRVAAYAARVSRSWFANQNAENAPSLCDVSTRRK
jgi:hypothetical protein